MTRVVAALAALMMALVLAGTASAYYRPPHNSATVTLQFDWKLSSPFTAAYVASSTANIMDSDEFEDAAKLGANHDPTQATVIIHDMHVANKYAICYVEAGAYQKGFPDDGNFAVADYGATGSYPNQQFNRRYQMDGYPDEYYLNIAGFAGYTPGATLTGTAANIATALGERIAGCHAEGQEAIEPDDLDGYTNESASGAKGGGWGLTQADAAGFEQWLAYTAHRDDLAIFQKNDGANTAADYRTFDGMIIEECNAYDDPCGAGGDNVQDYVNASKPVLNAEYTQDGETTAKFCSADDALGINGSLLSVNLDGSFYQSCTKGRGYVYGH
jgi:hypothetical protein